MFWLPRDSVRCINHISHEYLPRPAGRSVRARPQVVQVEVVRGEEGVISKNITPGRGSSCSWLSDPFMATAAITVLSLPCQSPHFPQLKWFINNFLPRERERSSYCTPLPWISFSPSQTLKSFDHQYRSALHRVIFSWIVRKPIICPATGRARLNLSGPTCVKRRVERMKTIMMSWAISLISDMLPRVVPAH